MSLGGAARICLVTEELSFGKGSGGIGGAFHELALLLRRSGHPVDVLYLPGGTDTRLPDDLVAYYDGHGIRVVDPAIQRFVWGPFSYEKRSYGIFRHLLAREEPYDFIHFHDYKGLGFASLSAKRQRLAFPDTTFIVQTHGPTRWTLAVNDHPFSHEDQLKIDFMERRSIALADILVSPSRYMIGWLKQNKWTLPSDTRVIQNVSLHLSALLNPRRSGSGEMACNEIILFGRHEERKGIVPFCDALDLIGDRLAARNVTVTFLGGFGVVNGEVSPLYLVNRSRKWNFPMRFLPDFDRLTACRYIANSKRSVVVVPSLAENSPCTVLEAAIVGRPLITSAEGGASELLDPAIAPALTCKIDRKSLAARLVNAVDHGLPPARPAVPPEKTARLWIDLHRRPTGAVRPAQPTAGVARAAAPKVVAAITHYERPAKLYDALMSLVTQTYPNLEIVVVDDGSESDETQDLLRRLEPLMTKLRVRLLYQDNRYLGAARNHAIVNSKSEYVLFLDDDDIAFPNLVQTLVTAAEATRADVVNCLNLYMPESRRTEAHPFPDQFSQKVSYVPIGGPVSMAPLENCFGAATALLRRSALDTVSGYTEQRGIGHEDFELYTRILQSGLHVEVCPLPLYLYEVDHSGMVACTSPLRNWNRIALAIDVTAKPEAWSDFVSVVAGRRAQEHAQNFAQYKVATSLHKDVLKQLGDEPQQSVRYAELLSEYAASTGATAAMQAAHALAATRSNRPDDVSAPIMPLPLAMTTVSRESEIAIEGLALGILIDLSFGRVAEAVSAFTLLWERQGCLGSPTLKRILLALANRPDLTSEQAGRVLMLLKQRHFSQTELKPLVAAMFRFALRCQDMQAASALADRAILADEEAYLRANQDVALAVSGDRFPAALDHFAYAGQKEGRPGFETVREIQEALQAHLGVDVPVTSLRQSIPSGQKVQRVPAVSPGPGRKSAPRWGAEKSGTLHALSEAAAGRRTRVTGS